MLTFSSAPNFESATDSDKNNTYVVAVTATDNGTGTGTGTLTGVQTITVTVQDVNDAPVITSNGGGATASISLVENTTVATTVTASDADSNTITYSLTGGADQAKFAINATTGALTFVAAPSFATPTDAGANNVYDVQVTATDNGTGNLTDVQTIAVTITATPPSSGGGSTTTTSSTTIDGVTASTIIQSNGTAVTTIAPVNDTRQDDPGSLFSEYADIPVVTNANGETLLTVSLPVGVGLNIEGKSQPLNMQSATDDLIQRITQKNGSNNNQNQQMTQHAEDFLSSLASNE